MRTLAIVFTKRRLTQDQLAQAKLDLDYIYFNSNQKIPSTDKALKIVMELFNRIKQQYPRLQTINIYGTIPPPIRWALLRFHNFTKNITNIRIYESFNTKRSKEGEKPTFEHKEWLHTQTI